MGLCWRTSRASPVCSLPWRSLLEAGREGERGGGRGRGVKDVISPAPLHRLFHVIVDTDRTASQILSIMNKQKLPGEVTFLPLNKLNPPTVDYPNAKTVCKC